MSYGKLVDEVLGHIQVSKLSDSVVEKDIGGLDVSMDDVGLMQFVESFQSVVGHSPNSLFGNAGLESERLLYFILSGWWCTCRSPSFAISMTMHSVSDFSS